MKDFFKFLRSRPSGAASVVVLCFLYLIMIFAEFIAPYPSARSFEDMTYHPPNLRIGFFNGGFLQAQEARVINPVNWKYARIKELRHNLRFFVKCPRYKLCGFIPCSRKLFGVKDDAYPIFLMGADNLGRDLFSRVVYGSRISLTIGFIATAVSLVFAVFFGGIAGYFGGKIDWAIMRFSEFFMLVPSLYLILFFRSLLSSRMDPGRSYAVITIILAFVGWPSSARTVRGLVHSIKREEFVLNARLESIPVAVILCKYIIPQISSLLIVSVALSIPGFIMSETTLSYLGLGVAEPSVSWGSLIRRDISTINNLRNYPWLLNPVWLLLAITLAFNFLGDVLRDFFDPHHTIFKKFSFARLFKRSERGTKNNERNGSSDE